MKFYSPRKEEGHKPSKRGRRTSKKHLPLPENAVFWMMLLLLTIGSVARLYEKSVHGDSALYVSSGSVFQGTATTGRNYKVSGKKIPIYCVETQNPQIALSFEVSGNGEDVRRMLEILEQHQLKATFFVTGKWVLQYPNEVKLIANQGHDLGNHSEGHQNMSQMERREIRQELAAVHDKVKELIGADMVLFRPPYGDYDNDVIEVADSMGYYPVLWDADSLDWKDYGSASIVAQVLDHPHLGNGSIVRLHCGAKYTPQAMEKLITGIEDKGYELVPVSQLIWKEGYHVDPNGRQISEAQIVR